jgi:hypothetical protein
MTTNWMITNYFKKCPLISSESTIPSLPPKNRKLLKWRMDGMKGNRTG